MKDGKIPNSGRFRKCFFTKKSANDPFRLFRIEDPAFSTSKQDPKSPTENPKSENPNHQTGVRGSFVFEFHELGSIHPLESRLISLRTILILSFLT